MKMGWLRHRLVRSTAIVLLLALLALGHYVYWYRARERPGVPSPGLAARLLTSDAFDAAVWLPYPHQNLGHLRRVAGFEGEALAAAARLGGLPSPDLPSFGSMVVPPASELAVASSADGEHFVVCAKVYPAFGAFARLSGRLAGNPWLAGGTVSREGREATVAWRDGWWTISTGPWPELGSADTLLPPWSDPPALAFLEVHRPSPPLAAGRYALWRDGTALELGSRGFHDQPPPFADEALTALGTFLLALDHSSAAPRALAFFSLDGVDLPELPRASSLHAPGGERWELPGESLLGLTGRKPKSETVGGWVAESLDSAGLEQAVALQPAVRELASHPLDFAVWLDLEAALAEVSRLARILDAVPLVPRRRVRQWRDVESVLDATVHHFDRLTVEVGEGAEGPEGLRLRLDRRAEVAP